MVRLLISVEGLSEYKFINEVVISHLAKFNISVESQNIKGNVNLDKIKSKLNSLIHNFDCVTTLYDFYGFRGKSEDETQQSLEEKIKQSIKKEQQKKIISYIQMYEFEALLFSDSKKMASELNTDENWINEILKNFNHNPEAINNSKETAPSKRIDKNTTYIKTTHAPKILKNIGLKKIREKCQGFDAWLTKLEALGE
jgi:hypothetical protein